MYRIPPLLLDYDELYLETCNTLYPCTDYDELYHETCKTLYPCTKYKNSASSLNPIQAYPKYPN
ncbi:hypothetical protein Hanom_Chr17g01547181 [Helianthus anomalus]